MKIIDSHAHLNNDRLARDADSVLERAKAAGVAAIVNVGYDLPSSRRAAALAAKDPIIYAAAGIHPHDAKTWDERTGEELRILAQKKKVVAVGEIGLDYYYNHSPQTVQQTVFRLQIQMARELRLPVIIHDRDAHADTLNILRQERAEEVGGVMHCFSGDARFAMECLQLGFYLSLAGPVTFKNSGPLAQVARLIPRDRLLVETDAPYLAPDPWRGKRNEPAYILKIVERVAELREEAPETIADAAFHNAISLFRLTGPQLSA